MSEFGTFSSLVDEAASRSGRLNLLSQLTGYARQTVRECQALALFKRDFIELTRTTTAAPDIWTTPADFRIFWTVRYPVYDAHDKALYPKELRPGKEQGNNVYFFYGAQDYYVFAGNAIGTIIDLAYFSKFPHYAYYAVGARPATYDIDTGLWSYLAAATDPEKLAAQAQVSNWLIYNWWDVLIEGIIAKLYKNLNDPRAVSSFALYKSFQKDLEMTETTYALGR